MERPYAYGGVPRYAEADRCRECDGCGTISYSNGEDIDYVTCEACGGKGRLARKPAAAAELFEFAAQLTRAPAEGLREEIA